MPKDEQAIWEKVKEEAEQLNDKADAKADETLEKAKSSKWTALFFILAAAMFLIAVAV